MPSTIIPPGYAQVFWRFRVAGDNEEMLTSMGVRTVGAPVDPDDLANEMAGAWTASLAMSDLHTSYTFIGTRVYIGQDGDPIVAERLVNLAGTGGNLPLPNNCAILAQKRSALGGRRNRGRMFIPAGYLPESGVDGAGVLAAGTLGAIQANLDQLLNEIENVQTTTDQAVILHSSNPSTPTQITSLICATKIATQRTRMRR